MLDFRGFWEFRAKLQIDEALGADNRWFCSMAHGEEITNPELLLEHYIKNGGAIDFAQRFIEAMSSVNRWFCSQYYQYPVDDLQKLWDYYMQHAPARAMGNHSPSPSDNDHIKINIAC